VKDFVNSLGSKDWPEACQRLTDGAKAQLAVAVVEDVLEDEDAAAPELDCEESLKAAHERLDKGVFSAKARIEALANIEDVDVAPDEDSATVTYAATKNDDGITIEDAGSWELEEVGDEWRIDSPLPFVR
jgi:hypothetical protein